MIISILSVTTLPLKLIVHNSKFLVWQFAHNPVVSSTMNTLFHLFAIIKHGSHIFDVSTRLVNKHPPHFL